MPLYLALLFLVFSPMATLGNHLEVVWTNNSNFYLDEKVIQEVHDGTIKKIELPSFKIIFPGTLWCGTGNISKSEDDLGIFPKTDSCCRTHDMCNDTIDGGATKYNLTNPSFYTRLNCRCDLKFYNCLQNAKDAVSNKVGFIFFDILGTKCYRLDYPVTKCKKKVSFLSQRCLEYEYDKTGEKKYQWFDVPLWKFSLGSSTNNTDN